MINLHQQKVFLLIAIMLLFALTIGVMAGCGRLVPDSKPAQSEAISHRAETETKLIEDTVIKEHLDRADAFYSQGDYDSALAECNLIIEQAPLHPKLNLLLASIAQKKNELDKAKHYLQIALDNEKVQSERSFYWLALAELNIELNLTHEAVKALNGAEGTLSPDSPNYQIILRKAGILYYLCSMPDNAYRLLEQYFAMVSLESDPSALRVYARVSVECSSQNRDALTQLFIDLSENEIIKLHRRRLVAGWYSDSNQTMKAAELMYQNLLNEDKADATDLYLHTGYWRKIKDKQAEKDQLEALVIRYPENLTFRKRLALCLKNEGRFDEARVEYRTALSIKPNDIAILLSLGELEYDVGQYTESIKYFEKLHSLEPGEIDNLWYLAKAYERNINPEKALKIWKKVREEANSALSTKTEVRYPKFTYRDFLLEADKKIELLAAYKSISPKLKEPINRLVKIISLYGKANDKRIEGIKKTTPNYEVLPYGNERIVTSYNVSPDIYVAEQIYRDCSSEASKLLEIPEASNIQSLIVEAGNRAAEGVALFARGYYIKEKDYSGEYERGRALIEVANQKLAQACELLIPLVRKHFLDFDENLIEKLEYDIKYYRKKWD